RLQGPRHTGREVVNLLDVAFSPDGQILASTTSDRKLLLWDVATGKLRHNIQGPPNGAYRLVFSPNGRTLAGGGFDDTVYLWDVATGREIAGTAGGHTSVITQIAFSADGRTLVTAGDDSTIWLWEAATGRPRLKLDGHD